MATFFNWLQGPVQLARSFVVGAIFALIAGGYQRIFPEPSVGTVLFGLVLWLVALIFILHWFLSLHIWTFRHSRLTRIFLGVLIIFCFGWFAYGRYTWARRRFSTQPVVKIHFKESSALTSQRRQSIQREFDDFYEYLSGVGFKLPKELPPIGTRRGKAMAESFQLPAQKYGATIYIPEDSLDSAQAVTTVYAHHIFRGAFGLYGMPLPSEFSYQFGYSVESIFSSYYVSSFMNKNLEGGDDTKWAHAKWVNAIWDIRDEYGQDFADRTLFYVSEVWRDRAEDEKDFDHFFVTRFLAGLSVIDNARQNEASVKAILAKRGLQPD